MKRFFKMTLLIIGSLIVVLLLTSYIFIKTAPQFGAKDKNKKTSRVLNSTNYKDGAFHNIEDTTVMTEFKLSSLKEYFNKKGKAPHKPVPIERPGRSLFSKNTDSTTKITWFGHSTVLLEISEKRIFIDPMFGDVPAPHKKLGPKKYFSELPVAIDSIPYIDAVLISHDHYDHLDYNTIIQLKDKVGKFYVPLGVDAHLRAWGIDDAFITDLDWWDETNLDDLSIIATPARHFSGRKPGDRNSTQWCSYVIKSNTSSLYYSGDSGYGIHFKEIGDKYGPFDYTFLECGQYNEQWSQIHMMPEEVVQANTDLQGKQVIPIHWGAFTLALHTWTNPIERLIAEASQKQTIILTPKIGESIIQGNHTGYTSWWNDL